MSLSPLVAGIANAPVSWLDANAADADVVLFSRIRFLRNLSGFPFPVNASKTVRQKINELTGETLQQITGKKSGSAYYPVSLSELGLEDREILQERKWIPSHTSRSHHCKTVFLPQQTPVQPWLLTHYDCHISIQVIGPGNQTDLLWQKISPFEQELSGYLPFAFRQDLGYLTEQPCYTGTAMLVSAMLHLPCTCLSGKEQTLLRSLKALCFKARSFADKDQVFPGALFMICNESTLGESEEELLLRFQRVLKNIITEERLLREQLLTNKKSMLQNICGRALGMLQHSYLLSLDEAIVALTSLKLGIDCSLIESETSPDIFYRMLLPVQKAHLRFTATQQEPGDQEELMLQDPLEQRATLLRTATAGLREQGGHH